MLRELVDGRDTGEAAEVKFLDERDDITAYVQSLKAGQGLDEKAIRAGYQQFKDRGIRFPADEP